MPTSRWLPLWCSILAFTTGLFVGVGAVNWGNTVMEYLILAVTVVAISVLIYGMLTGPGTSQFTTSEVD